MLPENWHFLFFVTELIQWTYYHNVKRIHIRYVERDNKKQNKRGSGNNSL